MFFSGLFSPAIARAINEGVAGGLSGDETRKRFSPEARLERATKLKDHGTKEFLAGNYSSAEKQYRLAAEQLVSAPPPLPDEHAVMFVKCAGNAAVCFMKEEDWGEVVACCNQALGVAPDHANRNIKILYRRGVAKMHMGDLEAANADLTAAYQLDNSSRDVRRALKELKPKLAKLKKKEQKQFGGIFGKVSMYDEKTVNLFRVPSAKGDELTSFPDTVLATVAEFLTKSERALAAVAMTAPASSWKECNWKKQPCEASRVMVTAKPLAEIKLFGANACGASTWRQRLEREKSYNSDFLDFEDIDVALAAKLSDGDVGGMLVCIDAVNTLKKLELRGCINIAGYCLEPLRGSTVLEKIDLSLSAGSPILFPVPLISVEAVVPILESIIDDERSSLKYVQLPRKWKVGKNPLLGQFLAKYNRVLNDRQVPCSYKERYNGPECGTICCDSERGQLIPQSGGHVGIQEACAECMKMYCDAHQYHQMPFACEVCEKKYCMSCNETFQCDKCSRISCNRCTGIEMCGTCQGAYCGNCCPINWCEACEEPRCEDCCPYLFCDQKDCRQGNCMDCAVGGDEEEDWQVRFCTSCNATFCVEHLVRNLPLRDDEPCEECNERALSYVLDTNESILRYLHKWESACGYGELFETDLELADVSLLLREQKRMKERWECINGEAMEKLTEVQRKEMRLNLAHHFIV